MTQEPLTIVGGGLAALSATRSLRKAGYDGDIVVVTTEQHHPYERPPLTKDYLRGESDRSAAFTTAPTWWEEQEVDVRTATTAVGIDRAAHRVQLADGSAVAYRKLLLATGSAPRPLRARGADLRGVHTLRTIDDADLLSNEFARGAQPARLVVIGDGWIGMEVAASARQLGLEVTVIGHGRAPLAKVLGEAVGEVYGRLHLDNGVRLLRETEIAGLVGERGHVTAVELADGTLVPADVVVVGVGAAPNVGLALAAGLDVRSPRLGGGVAVDGTLVTSDSDIYAAGDIASIPLTRWRRPIRVEHWATALRTGAHAGRAMIGAETPYDRLPYFYSDQFDTNMEYSGFTAGPDGYDDVLIIGEPGSRTFAAFWLRRGRVEAGLTMNLPGRIGEVEQIIRAERPVDREELESFATAQLATPAEAVTTGA